MNRNNNVRYDVGVLFVHGIGLQARGDTLVGSGEALRYWIDRWVKGAIGDGSTTHVQVSDAFIGQDPADRTRPACAELTLRIRTEGEIKERSWLLAESWWAQAFTTPTYRSLAFWSLQVIPWTFASHFGTRLRRAIDRWTQSRATMSSYLWNLGRVLFEVVYFLVGLAFIPPVVLLELLLLIVGLLPIPHIRSAVGWLQRRLAGTIGDSFVLLGSPIQAAAIVGQVRRDMIWLAHRCRQVAIIGHSQGAAIAHEAVHSYAPPPQLKLLITLGSGLNKLLILDPSWTLMRGGSRGFHLWA
jgi:hypothetical protein